MNRLSTAILAVLASVALANPCAGQSRSTSATGSNQNRTTTTASGQSRSTSATGSNQNRTTTTASGQSRSTSATGSNQNRTTTTASGQRRSTSATGSNQNRTTTTASGQSRSTSATTGNPVRSNSGTSSSSTTSNRSGQSSGKTPVTTTGSSTGSRAPQNAGSVTASSSIYRNSSRTPANTADAKRTPPIQVAPPKPSVQQGPGHYDYYHYEHRIPPHQKDYVYYRNICRYYDPGFHYFGYRIRRLPSASYRVVYRDKYYYCCEGIYYCRRNNEYYICRPPYETMVAREMMRQIELAAVRIRYYNTVNQTFTAINKNNSYITSQNETIARNNEIIARQQRIIAENNEIIQRQNLAIARASAASPIITDDGRFLAASAYDNARQAGLVQSYAANGVDYFYQDGVFYVADNGKYRVIVPPAGALVDYLPEDYELVTLGGKRYYQVDDTVYQVSDINGTACFEVLGQLEN